MPVKIRELKATLSAAGFVLRPGKGSHTVWSHPDYPEIRVVIAGQNGDDAHAYQVALVRSALRKSGK